MADIGTIETYLAGLDSNDPRVRDQNRKILKAIFEYMLKDLRFGRSIHQDPSKNFGGGFFKGTTDAVANTEFSIEHTFGRTPYLLIPVLPLDTVGARIVPLEVSKAADSSKVYLKSSETSKTVYVYIEG